MAKLLHSLIDRYKTGLKSGIGRSVLFPHRITYDDKATTMRKGGLVSSGISAETGRWGVICIELKPYFVPSDKPKQTSRAAAIKIVEELILHMKATENSLI